MAPEIVESKLLLVLAGIALLYIMFRLLAVAGRGSRNYERRVDSILNSEEYKVKGRFE